MSDHNGTAPQPPPATLESLREQRQMARMRVELKRLQREEKLLESLWGWDNDGFGGSDESWTRLRRGSPDGTSWVPLNTPSDRRHGGNWPMWRTLSDLDELRQKSRIACTSNGYARGLLRNVVNYLIGDGFSYKAGAKKVRDANPTKPGLQEDPKVLDLVAQCQEVIDDFIVRNHWTGTTDANGYHVITGSRERESARRVIRDGECLIRCFGHEDGTTSVRWLAPEQLRDPPGGTLAEGWSYGSRHQVERLVDPETGQVEVLEDIENVQEYYAVYLDPTVASGVKDASPTGIFIPANEVIHLKGPDTDSDIKRGTPEFSWDTLEAFERAAKLARNLSIGAAIRAATAEYWEHANATASQVESMASGLKTRDYTDPETGRTERVEKIRPGAIRRGGAGQKLTGQPPDQTPSYIQGLQADLRQGASAFSAPEYMVSADASNNSYSSTKEAGSPWAQNAKALHGYYKAAYLRVIWWAVRWAVKCGRLPEEVLTVLEIQVEAPVVVYRDESERANTDKTLAEIKVKSPKTSALERGLDPEREAANFEEWDAKFAPKGPPGIPGMPGGEGGEEPGGPGQPPGGDGPGKPPGDNPLRESKDAEGPGFFSHAGPEKKESGKENAPAVNTRERYTLDGWPEVFDPESGQWLTGDQVDLDEAQGLSESRDPSGHEHKGKGPGGGQFTGPGGWGAEGGQKPAALPAHDESVTKPEVKPSKEETARQRKRERARVYRQQQRQQQQKELAERLRQAPRVSEHSTEFVEKKLAEFFPEGGVSADELPSLIGAPRGGLLYASRGLDDKLVVQVDHPHIDHCQRTLHHDQDGNLVMHNDLFFLKKKQRGSGMGLQVFSEEVRTLARLGVDRIETCAGKGGIMNGYYTWAVLGYDAPLYAGFISSKRLRNQLLKPYLRRDGKVRPALSEEQADAAVAQLKGARTVQDLMAVPEGREYWLRNGYQVGMRFDLKEGSRSLQVLNAYLQAKDKEPIEANGQAVAALRQKRQAAWQERRASADRQQEKEQAERSASASEEAKRDLEDLRQRIRTGCEQNGFDQEGLQERAQHNEERMWQWRRENPTGVFGTYDPIDIRRNAWQNAYVDMIVERHNERMADPGLENVRRHMEKEAVSQGLEASAVRERATRLGYPDRDAQAALEKSYRDAIYELLGEAKEVRESLRESVSKESRCTGCADVLLLEAATPARFSGEKKDSLGRRICFQAGKRVVCPKRAQTAPAKPVKLTTDQVHQTIQGLKATGVTHQGLQAVAGHIGQLSLKEIADLKVKLGVKASGNKAQLARKILAKATAPTRPTPAALVARVQALRAGTPTAADIAALAADLAQLPVKEIVQVKAALKVRAAGAKAQLAHKIAERALAAPKPKPAPRTKPKPAPGANPFPAGSALATSWDRLQKAAAEAKAGTLQQSPIHSAIGILQGLTSPEKDKLVKTIGVTAAHLQNGAPGYHLRMYLERLKPAQPAPAPPPTPPQPPASVLHRGANVITGAPAKGTAPAASTLATTSPGIPFKHEQVWTTGMPEPGSLNGVPFASAPPKFWEQTKDVDVGEPPLRPNLTRAGVLIQEPDGRVWIVQPTNGFGGRDHTLPGGTLEKGLTTQQNALKEVWEETGLQVEITGYAGDFNDSNYKSGLPGERFGRLYIGRRVGGAPWDAKIEQHIISKKTGNPAAESETVTLVTPERAAQLLHRSDDLAQLAVIRPIPVDTPTRGKGSEPLKKLLEALGPKAAAYKQKALAAGGQAGVPELHAAQEMRGFNKTPTVVSKNDMDALLAKGDHVEMLRGVKALYTHSGKLTAAQLADQFRTGDHYPGNGCFGSGTYADSNKGHINAASRYANSGGNIGAIIRMALPKTAKIIKHSELEKLVPQAPDAFPKPDGHHKDDEWLGIQAALAGYDAIEVDGKSTRHRSYGKGYYVILNRGIVTVQKEDATGHVIK
jgi:8-oxo-dGTP pyrophosphatase MutT (NUDIX family)